MNRASQRRAPSTAVAALIPLAALIAALPASCGLNVQGSDFDRQGAGGSDTSSSQSSASSSSSSSTSTSSSGSSSTSGSSSSSGAGGSIGSPEDCLDGKDNDLDGLTDCADNECQPGFECVAAAPAGWTPVRAAIEGFNAPPPSCAPATIADTFLANPNVTACTPCSCAPSANACVRPTLTCWYDNNKSDCTQGEQIEIKPTMDGCDNNIIPTLQDKNALKGSCSITALSGAVAPGATCAPNASVQIDQDPFANRVYTCENPTTGGGCGVGQICVPKAIDDYIGSECVAKAGTSVCPGSYPNGKEVYDAAVDQRSCGACVCNNVTLSCASDGKLVVWDTDVCGGTQKTFQSFNICQDVTAELGGNSGGISAMNTPMAKAQGVCTGGTAFGSVVPSDPSTICCK